MAMICDDCEYAEKCEQDETFNCPFDDTEPTNSELYMMWD